LSLADLGDSPGGAGFSPMQSIFSPAARRDTLRERANLDRRDGELKMDWTKPTHDVPDYVF
jgi:hypothetical protein